MGEHQAGDGAGALDPLTKGWSIWRSGHNGCGYWHREPPRAARKAGMSEGDVRRVDGRRRLANETNRLANGYRVPIIRHSNARVAVPGATRSQPNLAAFAARLAWDRARYCCISVASLCSSSRRARCCLGSDRLNFLESASNSALPALASFQPASLLVRLNLPICAWIMILGFSEFLRLRIRSLHHHRKCGRTALVSSSSESALLGERVELPIVFCGSACSFA